jgi:L-lactate dehydrogenase complex protein LldG
MSDRPARADVLEHIRRSCGKADVSAAERNAARAEAKAYIAAHQRGPVPRIAPGAEALAARFIERSLGLASSADCVDSLAGVPAAVMRYLQGMELPRAAASWAEFASLPWSEAGLHVESRAASGGDKVGITGVFCAIAETGTLAILSTARTPTVNALLPDTHVAILRRSRIVPAMEDAFALVRRELGRFPRALNFISGPSRTADIAQTLVLGAHGPYRVHVVVVND